MCSIFISFIFIKNVSINSKTIDGSAIYRDVENNNYNEILFKGYLGGSEPLIIEFNKNCILQVTGQIVIENGTEYLNFIQTILIEEDLNKTELPEASPLIVVSAPYVENPYKKIEDID
ncbi:5017_t:CDS:2, partial [Entrophospora sp. SA101]